MCVNGTRGFAGQVYEYFNLQRIISFEIDKMRKSIIDHRMNKFIQCQTQNVKTKVGYLLKRFFLSLLLNICFFYLVFEIHNLRKTCNDCTVQFKHNDHIQFENIINVFYTMIHIMIIF